MPWKAVLMMKHEDSSSGTKRVILKSKDWEANFKLVNSGIKSKWGSLELGQNCYIVIGDSDVDSSKSLENAILKLSSLKRVDVIIKSGALKSQIGTVLIYGSKTIDTSVPDNITLSELHSLIGESFGNLNVTSSDLKIYQIDNEKDINNMDIEIVGTDDLEGAIDVSKEDNNKLYLLIKV